MLKYKSYLFVWPMQTADDVLIYDDEGTAFSRRDGLRDVGTPAEVEISSGYSADEMRTALRHYRAFYERKRAALAAAAIAKAIA